MDSTMPGQAQEKTILLVDDEHEIVALCTQALYTAGGGYSVIPTTSPVEALRIAEQHQHRIHLLVTDVMMPEMNGFDLADRLKFAIPNLKILFMSGYVAEVNQDRAQNINFLAKPFSLQALCATVHSILDGNAGF